MKTSIIANNIRKFRKEKGLSQVELAEKAGVSALTIVRIENEQVYPIPVTLKALALALGCKVETLKGE